MAPNCIKDINDNSNSNRATASSINKGWSAVEAAAESAATLVPLVVGLLKKLFWEQCFQRNAFKILNVTDTRTTIDDWGETSSSRRLVVCTLWLSRPWPFQLLEYQMVWLDGQI